MKNKKILIYFLITHIFIWTLVPTISNTNLPLDTIEVLGWGNELKLGYDKYPPLFPLFTEFFFKIFGNKDFAFYLLSQLFVASSFLIIFKISNELFNDEKLSILSVLLLEGIFFHNYTTPELNAFLCQLPFLAATALYFWKSISYDKNIHWFLLGIFSGLAALTYYLTFYLLAAISLFFIFEMIKYKRFNSKYLIGLFSFLIVLSPHLFWIIDNNYSSIEYALFRSFGDPLTGLGGPKVLDHLIYPLIFLGKQIILIIPLIILIFSITTKLRFNINYKDKKFLFLFTITILPIILMFLTSLLSGIRIRTMWMTTFYLFIGIFSVYLFQLQINFKKIKLFMFVFIFFFLISPLIYFVDSYTQKDKRTDYPGKKIANLVQIEWDKNFENKIEIVAGDGWVNGGWYAGNLSYHLSSRPKLRKELNVKINVGLIWIKGFNEIKECKGTFFQVEPYNDICMFGNK